MVISAFEIHVRELFSSTCTKIGVTVVCPKFQVLIFVLNSKAICQFQNVTVIRAVLFVRSFHSFAVLYEILFQSWKHQFKSRVNNGACCDLEIKVSLLSMNRGGCISFQNVLYSESGDNFGKLKQTLSLYTVCYMRDANSESHDVVMEHFVEQAFL